MDRKGKKRRQILIIIAALVIGAAFLQVSGLSRSIAAGVASLGNGLGSVLFGRASEIRSQMKEDEADPQQKISELEREVERLQAENAAAKMLEEENAQLRAQIQFSEQSGTKSLPAKIVGRAAVFGLEDEQQEFVIDRGSRDGLRPGLAVTNQLGIILGKIVDVSDNSSTLCLAVSKNCQFPASIINSSKTSGLTEGNLGLTIKMNYIPQSEEIKEGDYVVTSGLGGNIPRGLLIGRVSQINIRTNEVWQDVTIEPGSSIDNSTIVSVIIP